MYVECDASDWISLEKRNAQHIHDNMYVFVLSFDVYLRPRSQYDKLPTVTPSIDPLILMILAGGTPLTAHTCVQTEGCGGEWSGAAIISVIGRPVNSEHGIPWLDSAK